MDKAHIEKRILEEYDEFVFQGYSTEEIAYMGTCLQRWAIEKRVGPMDIKPYIQNKADDPLYWKDILTRPLNSDPAFWLRQFQITFLFAPISLMALHGFLCLALRHPSTRTHDCRLAIVLLVKQIGETLVDMGALTPDTLREVQRIEVEEGN